MRHGAIRAYALHLAVIAGLFLLQYLLPAYHMGNLTRIMIYAVLAIGYNILFGYTGLLSLGHAMFFASGAYGAGLAVHWLGFGPISALAGRHIGASFLVSMLGPASC